MDAMKGAFIAVFGVPLAVLLIAYMWRHPVGAIVAIGLIVLVFACLVYNVHLQQTASGETTQAKDDANFKLETARHTHRDSWKPRAEALETEEAAPEARPVDAEWVADFAPKAWMPVVPLADLPRRRAAYRQKLSAHPANEKPPSTT